VAANGGFISRNLGTREIAFFANLQGFTADRRAVPCSAELPELQDFGGEGDVAR